jgi:hypothetical protein
MTWSGFIHAAASSQHAVHVYDELDDLAESVAGFVDAGLRTGAPAVVIAIPDLGGGSRTSSTVEGGTSRI